MSQKVPSRYAALTVAAGRKLLTYVDDIQLNNRLICLKCNDILIEPYQTPCGCRLCLSCLGGLTERCEHLCPICNGRWSGNDRCIYDRAVQREINGLKINCINEGCTYKCKLWQLMDHLEECAYRAEKCQQCGKSYPCKYLEEHRSTDCKMSKVKCSDCNIKLTRQDLDEVHRNVMTGVDKLCNKWKGVCPYGCCEDVQENLKFHLYECPRLPIHCTMKFVGCAHLVPRGSMEDHLRKWAPYHVGLLASNLTLTRNENRDLKSQFSESCRANSSLKKINHHLLKKNFKLIKKVMECEGGNEMNDREENVPQLCHSMVETKGEYLWKVCNIFGKIRRAKAGNDVIICSDHFYSNHPGYRLCLMMYPNGYGDDLGTHLSIFFVIMEGRYDDEVPWPFCRKISITLVANNGKTNRVRHMDLNRNEHCYRRPKAESDVAGAIHWFMSHSELCSSDDIVENGSINILVFVQ